MTGKIFSSPHAWGYVAPGHPEAPSRVQRSVQYLKSQGWPVEGDFPPATSEDLLRVHSPSLLQQVQSGQFEDPDTPVLPHIDDFARWSAGAALAALASALQGTPAFSLMRPPGHHAGRSQLGGFCYFNNLAGAVEKALAAGHRVTIVDIDVHHGNGTQDIVQGKPDLLFLSLHQVPLYPGTGLRSEGNCLNIPLSPGTTGAQYLKALEQAMKRVETFKPTLLAVSAGFDTYKEDPLANLALDLETYVAIGQRLAALGCPRFAVLEGGYSTDLPQCIERFLTGFFE
ncbi:MAG: histone deacetylase [Elusimicrobia bacterium]|nr:histone deacetylase [Elusimicrobiota bacterium]